MPEISTVNERDADGMVIAPVSHRWIFQIWHWNELYHAMED